MEHIRFRVIRPVVYLIIGVILLIIAWSFEADSIYAKLRMKMSQSAPSISTEYEGMDLLSSSLKEALESGTMLPSYGEQYGTLTCGEIGLSAPLYYGDDEDILLKGVGQYPLDTIPGMGGSYLIAGHDTTYFGCLADVDYGDVIELSIGDITYYYTVTDTKVMKADQFVLEQVSSEKERLILYTCYPLGGTENSRDRRLFVYCDLNK